MNQLKESLRAFRGVFANPNLRRIELGLAGSIIGGWAYGIALSVFAYKHGGAAAVGYVNLMRWIPAAAAAPFTSVLADRFPRQRVMLAADLIRAAALAVAVGAFFADAPAAAIYGVSILVSIVSTTFVPAQAALLPSLAATPEELTAANVTSSTIESVGLFAGPALGGLLLAATSTGVVFATTAVTFLWSALMISRIRITEAGGAGKRPDRREPAPMREEALAGFRAIGTEGRLRLLISLFAGQTFVDGALNVLVVVLAFRVLDLGEAGVGFLNSAIGVGGLVGAVAAMFLVGRHRLASGFGLGMLLWGAPIAVIALWPKPAVALVMLALVGVGNTIVDVAGMTLMQRAVVDEILGRVFGVMESVLVGAVALGSVIAPAVVAGLGPRGALLATGAVLPVLTLLAWRGLAAIDAAAAVPEKEVRLLRANSIFAVLPEARVEKLASRLTSLRVGAGEVVIRQGDTGDRFYLVTCGELEAAVDGRPVSTLGAGSSFGEIALLRDVPRTASVTALEDSELLALERDDFLAAVTGHAASAEAADAVVRDRLAMSRSAIGSI